jgi:hypothetical protein
LLRRLAISASAAVGGFASACAIADPAALATPPPAEDDGLQPTGECGVANLP